VHLLTFASLDKPNLPIIMIIEIESSISIT